MKALLDLSTRRAREARLGKTIGKTGAQTATVVALLGLAGSIALFIAKQHRYAYLLATPTLIAAMTSSWWSRQLSHVPIESGGLVGQLSGDVLARLQPHMQLTPKTVWQALSGHWQLIFFTNHLLISPTLVTSLLEDDPVELEKALAIAKELAEKSSNPVIELGYVAAGILLASPQIKELLTHLKLRPEDVRAIAAWLSRGLDSMSREHPVFGGIARDWTFGFTPLLNRFGENVSQSIMHYGSHFGWLTTSVGVQSIEGALANNAAAVALIGQNGIGKTSHVYGLAQRLIEGQGPKSLNYHQVVSLHAGDILSNAAAPGQLERLLLSLSNEASQAGHIILFLDDADLFFGSGPGAFDAVQILLPIVQARATPLILAMTPTDFQRLRTNHSNFASLLTPVVLQELPEANVMSVLEDSASNFESRHNLLIPYEALRESYRLSGRYEQDDAYPGKAIALLERAIPHAENGLLNAAAVQRAIEQTKGVKVGGAQPAEADTLLHLEDLIHERMINQTRAVEVVANALRRARAGVANPRRPLGSFLFLGPTGVGKTELAKAVAAVYFGSETNMLRLDMSEYQSADDVQRLLSDGQDDQSLIMAVRQQPFSVVLLDEIEKAHPNILNLMLQMLDEGQLTDSGGRAASFKDCIIIATSNAGANTIREHVERGEDLQSFEAAFTDELITSGQFKPELLNRFDEIVLFRPLKEDELAQVVKLMLDEINQTLEPQQIKLELTDEAVKAIVAHGYDARLGARPMRRVLQRAVEDTVAKKILAGDTKAGDTLKLDVDDLHLVAPNDNHSIENN